MRAVRTYRAGAWWETVGFVIIAGGLVTALASAPSNHLGSWCLWTGFIVFVIGRLR